MPKFLYILLLVNFGNACQSEHQGSAAHPNRDSSVQADTLSPLIRQTTGQEETGNSLTARQSKPESTRTDAGQPLSVLPDTSATSQNLSGKTPPVQPENAATNEALTDASSGSGNQQVFTRWDALFADFDQFFRENVQGGRVRYVDLAVSPVVLEDLVRRIGETDLSQASAVQTKAFSINAYNVLVIWQVVEHYPIPSPMDIAGFFDRQTYLVAGKKKTLNELEAGLRSDPRVHFALVCGALGCPKILNAAYLPAKLDQQLDAVTRQALNDPVFMRYQEGDQFVELSQIFNWYAQDFGGEAAVLAYINGFRTRPIPEETAISYYDYNWKLNKTP
jgi:hypothetical protein